MPSKSPEQRKTMRAAAHSKEFADKVGIPQKVAQDFHRADLTKIRKKRNKRGK